MSPDSKPYIPDDLINYIESNQDVDLIYDLDVDREVIDVRPTTIYDVKPDSHIILAQTEPPVLKSAEGRRVEITLVYRHLETNKYQRYGFPATILVVLDRHELPSGDTTSMLVVSWPQTFRESGVRMHHRVEPSSGFGPTFFFRQPEEVEAQILDISLGGMRSWTPAHWDLKTRQLLRLRAVIDGQEYPLNAQVIRVIPMGRNQPGQVGLQFKDMPDEARNKLKEAIETEAREERRKLSGLV